MVVGDDLLALGYPHGRLAHVAEVVPGRDFGVGRAVVGHDASPRVQAWKKHKQIKILIFLHIGMV